jgi:hypothetical protein
MLGATVRWRTIHIDGHLCLDCCERLVRKVRSLAWVHQALLDVDDGILYVAHEPGPAAERRLDAAILTAGFAIRRAAPGQGPAIQTTLTVGPVGAGVRLH